jgi:glucose-6-phosphate 1-dehydrogenase
MNDLENLDDHVIVVFGGTGDLAQKKILPALRSLYNKGVDNPIVVIGREEYDIHGYIQDMDIGGYEDDFLDLLHYRSIDLDSSGGSKELKNTVEYLEDKHGTEGRLFYLALPYFLFEEASALIDESGLNSGKTKVAYEKPFGDSLASARKLQNQVSKYFLEDQIFRVDHYLGKEQVENILVLRFANRAFRRIWNGKNIRDVEIVLSEDMGVENRAEYYDSSGAIRDVVQNHILEMLSLVAMDEPDSLEAKQIQIEKTELLRQIEDLKPENVVYGQHGEGEIEDEHFKAYRDIEKVDDGSDTETFVAFKAFINTERWGNTSFNVKTGKLLDEKFAEIRLRLEEPDTELFDNQEPDVLKISIQPQTGISLSFHTNTPHSTIETETKKLESLRQEEFDADIQGAYETIFEELLKGDHTLFVNWNWLQESWKITEELIEIKKDKKLDFPNYKPGSKGPEAAKKLFKQKED